jgi:hypothetical protein
MKRSANRGQAQEKKLEGEEKKGRITAKEDFGRTYLVARRPPASVRM